MTTSGSTTGFPLTSPATDSTDGAAADHALKTRHRMLWASGDYPTLAADLISSLGPILVQAADVRRDQLVLDIAAGAGNASIPAAEQGATVVASDLTPELFDAGRAAAADRGVDIDWQEADAEALPFPDASFDTVLSCVGVMFAPHHQGAADELLRVVRSGGTIGLLNWTPTGFIGQLFATMKCFNPPPPPGAQPPPLWGENEHVRELLGDHVTNVSARRQTVTVDRFPGTGDFRRYFAAYYGPTISTYKNIAGDPERIAALDHGIDTVAERFTDAGGAMQWEYLLLTCTRT